MFSFKEMPSPSSLFSTYASMTASVMLFRTMANDLLPGPMRNYAISSFRHFFKSRSEEITVVIEESNGISRNQIYEASEVYLSTKLSPNTERIRISKTPKEKNITIHLEKNEKVVDFFEGVELKWKYILAEQDRNDPHGGYHPRIFERRSFELTFHKKHKDLVMLSYLPYVLEKAKGIREDQRVLKMFTLNNTQQYECIKWDSINLEHPSTFETLAMEPELKNYVIQDLNRFVKRKDFYKKVGKAWKRGYLLYGPPGTGKSSLVAAMANYLKFDVYDLQLGNVKSDSDLRRLLLTTGNRSILVIEDIDCSVDLPERRNGDGRKQQPNAQCNRKRKATRKEKEEMAGAQQGHFMLTLSGLLNFIDGLWSSCGDERIIVFTTNHKDRLDPALLRPGRMDMHIHMSYCTPYGFRLLASNYLGISGQHRLYKDIEGLIETVRITPAQVAEELMKSEDADVALEGLLKTLRSKQIDGYETEDEVETSHLKTRQKINDNNCNKPVIRSTGGGGRKKATRIS